MGALPQVQLLYGKTHCESGAQSRHELVHEIRLTKLSSRVVSELVRPNESRIIQLTIQSKRKAGVSQERTGERLGAAHATHPAPEGRGGVGEVLGAAVGQLAALDVSPQWFGRIQLGGVPRQPGDPQPVSLCVQVFTDQTPLVRRQLIPDQNDAPAADMAGQGL